MSRCSGWRFFALNLADQTFVVALLVLPFIASDQFSRILTWTMDAGSPIISDRLSEARGERLMTCLPLRTAWSQLGPVNIGQA